MARAGDVRRGLWEGPLVGRVLAKDAFVCVRVTPPCRPGLRDQDVLFLSIIAAVCPCFGAVAPAAVVVVTAWVP